MTYIKSKKAMDPSDLVGYVVMFIVIGFCFSFLFFSQDALADDFEFAAPNISYKFPPLFVHGFLNLELNNSEKEKLGFENESNIYIKDLYINVEEDFSEFIEEKKKGYINYYEENDAIEAYIDFSGENRFYLNYLFDSKLNEEELNDLDSLENYITENNYYVILVNDDFKTYSIIWFKESQRNNPSGSPLGGTAK